MNDILDLQRDLLDCTLCDEDTAGIRTLLFVFLFFVSEKRPSLNVRVSPAFF